MSNPEDYLQREKRDHIMAMLQRMTRDEINATTMAFLPIRKMRDKRDIYSENK
jgi:hypothetical protein